MERQQEWIEAQYVLVVDTLHIPKIVSGLVNLSVPLSPYNDFVYCTPYLYEGVEGASGTLCVYS